ncbi:MAG TPA: serine hydrolase domain-containing protein [Chloroflexota bacterium]|nr:serine hydrolase domain-containing protein [Chloroflexota bacterium]
MISLDSARDLGFDPDRLKDAFLLLDGWAHEGVIPGAGALVARGQQVAGEAYVGTANSQSGSAVDEGTVWSLASVTKPFTAGAVMLLVEEGKLSLDEPLCQLLPEFLDAPETAFDRKRVTLRHALSHCSGLPGFSEDNTDLRKAHKPLEEFVRSFGRQPLFFEPGAYHLYSNPGILMAAEVVGRALDGTLGERVEAPAIGRYHSFVHERILGPLGMLDSSLKPPAEWDARIARVERTGQEGTSYEGANSAYYRSLGIPWGGLFSTPRDLVRYVQLFLPSTEREGPLSRAARRAMVTVQCAPPDAPRDLAANQRDAAARTPPLPAVEWGIGWEIKGSKQPHRSGDLTSPATYGHAGATGTMVWACPFTAVSCVLLTNRTLVSGWTSERPRQAMFSNAVMASLL